MKTQHPLATRFIAEIELLAHKNNCLLWAMDSTFSQELFISGTFRTMLGRDVWEMYQNKSKADFDKNFNAITQENCFDMLENRLINPKYTAFYRFQLPLGGTQLVQDHSFHLNDENGECLLIAGVAVNITETDLSKQKQRTISDRIDKIVVELYQLLSLPLTSRHEKPAVPPPSELSKQQQLIFKYILNGLTAKEIAKKMDLSFRTVEFHTNTIKNIFGASTKSELISIAISKNHMVIRL